MTYNDFLSSLGYAFNLFVETITKWVNNLMSNYFFITILGVGLFISFVLFILDNINLIVLKKPEYDDKSNQYN